MSNLVAVYGTLRKTFGNHRVMEAAEGKYVDTLTKKLPYKMVSLGGFPALVKSGTEQEITVELYEVSDEGIERFLDRLEGYPHLYDREKVSELGDAWVYFMHESSRYSENSTVPSGDWKLHVALKGKYS